jgi:hypothetical protein
VKLDGDTPSVLEIVGRCISMLMMAGFGCGLLGMIDALLIFGEKRRCLHDRFAKTLVVVTDPRG